MWRPSLGNEGVSNGLWFTLQWSVSNVTVDGSFMFDPSGGTQGSEGFDGGGPFFIEGVLEELDVGTEWHFDSNTRQLYYASNSSTGAPPGLSGGAEMLEVVRTKVLVNISGTMARPVRNVTLQGLVFRDTAPTFLDRHELPSGGDWGLVHSAAVFAHGTQGLLVERCNFTRVDGQAVLLEGYHRDAVLRRNDMELIGSHAIVLWGKTSPCLDANCSRTLPDPAASGPDGRAGTQPIGTLIEGNVVRETGVYERHGTMFFSALAAMTRVSGNVFFNAARAAVNVNDGFGGGTWLDGNLIANAGRERNKDEGVINAWARQPYITNLRNGTDSTEPAVNRVSRNFLLGTYSPLLNVDTDDCASFWNVHDNFLAYGGYGRKGAITANDVKAFRNYFYWVPRATYAGGDGPAFSDQNGVFVNNTVVLSGGADPCAVPGGYASDCLVVKQPGLNMSVSSNSIRAAAYRSLTACGTTLAQWIAEGHDRGTTLGPLPATAEVIASARTILGLVPTPPPPPPAPAPAPTPLPQCTVWAHTVDAFYEPVPTNNLGQFAGLTVAAAQAWCCSECSCAGFSFARAPTNSTAAGGNAAAAPVTGSGYYKGYRLATVYKSAGVDGYAKPAAVPSNGPPKPKPPCPPAPPNPPACAHRGGNSACRSPFDPGAQEGVPLSFDCAMRAEAWEFAKATLPRRGAFKTVFDALQLQRCPNVTAPATKDVFVPPRFPTPAPTAVGTVIFVDAAAPAAGADGSEARPFATLEPAVIKAGSSPRGQPHGARNTTIVMKAGRYHTNVPAGIVLTSAHSGLTIQNFDGAEVAVSGTVPVPVTKDKWSVHDARTNTWRLDLAGWPELPAEAFGLRVGPARAVRARFPNGDPEVGTGYEMSALSLFPREHDPVNDTKTHGTGPEDWPGVFWLDEPEGGELPYGGANAGGTGRWSDFTGGICSGRQAPYGFWCSQNNTRSQFQGDFQAPYWMPGGFTFDPAASRISNWSRPAGAVFHLSADYFSVQCLVDSVDRNGTVRFDHSVGCDQGGPGGWVAHGWYAENVKEECDHPGEYFYDPAEPALYYTFNATDQPTGNEDFGLTVAKVIFNVSGTMADPVKGVTIRGLTIRDAALTFLGTTDADIHYIPSDADWVIQRSGAVLLEGTEGFVFEGNEVTKCDGNGLKLSNYNRDALIVSNEFSWIGDNAMSSFGSTGSCLYQNCSVELDYPSGVDGRAGNQPRYTRVVGNLVREVGMYQKQSGGWVQHLTAATHLESNVLMNGPHAAVDFNDGFGGGDRVVGNLMFNWNRQTIYHGVINVWERMPYISDVGMVRNFTKLPFNITSPASVPSRVQLESPDFYPAFDLAPPGTGSVVSPFRRIHNNFLIANYNSLAGVNLDDGGARALIFDNVLVYGQWGVGESCHQSQWVYGINNLYAYTTLAGFMISSEGPSPLGTRTFYVNSTFLNLRDSDWGQIDSYMNYFHQEHMNLTQWWNNSIHSPTGKRTGPMAKGGGNTFSTPMPDQRATELGRAILSPYPRSAPKRHRH